MKPTTNLREYVRRELMAELLEGKFPRNLPITEKQLIEKYQVSKSPVRDALIELCSEGILVALPRYGYMIVSYTPADITNISNFRLFTEPRYLDHYWEKFTPERLDSLEALVRQHEDASLSSTPAEHWQMNSEFHLALASVCQDTFYYRVLCQAMQQHIVAFSQFYWDYWNRESLRLFPAHHQDILACIRRQDRPAALKALEQDIATFHIPFTAE